MTDEEKCVAQHLCYKYLINIYSVCKKVCSPF
jgi:ferredoxin